MAGEPPPAMTFSSDRAPKFAHAILLHLPEDCDAFEVRQLLLLILGKRIDHEPSAVQDMRASLG